MASTHNVNVEDPLKAPVERRAALWIRRPQLLMRKAGSLDK